MLAPVSGLIEWKPSYSVGIASIDSQHQLLVSVIGNLQEAMMRGRTREIITPLFRAMNQYTQYHFQYEEELLGEHGYPGLEAHREQHTGLIKTLQELERKYEEGNLVAGAPLMQFLRTWLTNHIAAEDRDYAEFLKKQGVS
jgi:hemerythrin-like metal-binding protein